MPPAPTTVYTDGACSGNPGPGGWAWAVPGGRWRSGCEAKSTNQRMEILAAFDAVRTITGPVEVVSDSTYVVHCFRDAWWRGWLARGWVNSAKKPVANRDLWEPFVDLYRSDPKRVAFRWVKGHSGDPNNDLVDRLAVKAAQTQRPEEGGEPLASVEAAGPADLMADDVDAVDGFALVVGGLRPTALGGYDENPLAAAVRRRLVGILAAQQQLHPDLVVLTGMGLGAEQLGAEAAIAAGVPFVAVLPYPAPESVWPKAGQERFRDLVGAAKAVVTVGRRAPESKQQAGAALARRDAWLARRARAGLVVWDHADPNAGRLVAQLKDSAAVGEEEVWILDPADVAR